MDTVILIPKSYTGNARIKIIVLTWMNLIDFMLHEVRQTEKNAYGMISLRCGIWKKATLTETEWNGVCQRLEVGRCGDAGERCKVPGIGESVWGLTTAGQRQLTVLCYTLASG